MAKGREVAQYRLLSFASSHHRINFLNLNFNSFVLSALIKWDGCTFIGEKMFGF